MAFQERDAYDVVLGKVIAYYRQNRGWTQGQLAEEVGVQQSTISRIESGALSPDPYTFRQLAGAFGLSPAELTERVERAYRRTEAAARGVLAGEETPWWQTALGVAGVVGLAGLAIFAVAAALDESPPKRSKR